ncbi:MAG: NYN domain-containing protein [Reyranellaceae bacterium]
MLIDADNASAAICADLMAEIAKLGTASVKRIYGDFTSPRLQAWNGKILEHSIQQVQQPSFTAGKNASDIALVIDAMDLLHSKRFEGFCLVSSDSDFTRLAMRLREEGATVYGFGEKKTPRAFVAACDKFIYTEILRPTPSRSQTGTSSAASKPAGRRRQADANAPPVETLRDAVDSVVDDSGWAHLGRLGQVISNRLPDFDSRNYGHKNFVSLFEALPEFEVKRQGAAGGPQTVFVRIK